MFHGETREATTLMGRSLRLSKSRFTAGLQCHRQLWWMVHEPEAPELVPGPQQQAIFDQGRRVGEVARGYVPGGRRVDLPHDAFRERIAATRRFLDEDAPAIYEASFFADDVYAAVDILERDGDGHRLIEVKSSTRVRDEHVADIAIQLHVLRRCGLLVTGAELMHLNRECIFPDLADLFVRVDVTAAARRDRTSCRGGSRRSRACSQASFPTCRSGTTAATRTSARSSIGAGRTFPRTTSATCTWCDGVAPT